VVPVMIFAVLIFSGLNLLTGRKLISYAESEAVQTMKACATFLENRIILDDKFELDTILKEAARYFNVERITIINKESRVFSSSSSMFGYYDDFTDYHVDIKIFNGSMKSGLTEQTALKKIYDEYFQAVYHPIVLGHEHLCIVVESNRNFFTIVGETKRELLFNTVILWCVMVVLIATLLLFVKRHLKLLKLAQKQERLSFIGQTASELAHEMKNPLAIIKSSADILKKRFDPDGKDKVINFIGSETMRLSRTLDRVLNFAGNKSVIKQQFNLMEIITSVAEPVKTKWPEIAFEIDNSCNLELNADKDALYQIVWNLLNNSIDAMCAKGTISINFSPENKGTLFFADNGTGIPFEIQKTLFEPFVSGKSGGTGLGLSIVSSLCEKHGWKIGFKSSTGGTIFSIRMTEESWQKS
jgi:signal transduction histidine kinase